MNSTHKHGLLTQSQVYIYISMHEGRMLCETELIKVGCETYTQHLSSERMFEDYIGLSPTPELTSCRYCGHCTTGRG